MAEAAEVIDGSAVEEADVIEDGAGDHDGRTPAAAPSTALEPSRVTQALAPLDTEQVIEGFKAYQRLLHELLETSDWQGPPGQRGSFVKKSGWRKVARAFGLSIELVASHVERDAEGLPIRAAVTARAIAPNGQRGDADGYCSTDERRFAEAGGRQKLENDLRATATTRAKNRAIADLVGMGEVSAEEANGGTAQSGDAEPTPAAASDELQKVATNALVFLGLNPEQVLGRVGKNGDGKVPRVAAQAIVVVADEWRKDHPPAAQPPRGQQQTLDN